MIIMLSRLLDSISSWILRLRPMKGYIGLGLATPAKCKPGRRLNRGQKKNRVLNRLRSVVERVIVQVEDLADSSFGV